MLLGENQLLRSKLKDTEKLNDTLRNENNMFSRLHNQSTQDTGHQSTDDLLAGFVAEMRELRLRLEDSIRTNDALRAQLEKRLLSEGVGEAEGTGSGPDRIILIRENDTLRTEILEKDRVNEKLRRTIEGLKQEKTRWTRKVDHCLKNITKVIWPITSSVNNRQSTNQNSKTEHVTIAKKSKRIAGELVVWCVKCFWLDAAWNVIRHVRNERETGPS